MLIDRGGGNTDTIVAVSTSITLVALLTLDVAKVEGCFVGESYFEVAVFNDDGFNADAVLTSGTSSTCCASFTLLALDALFTLVTLIAFVALLALSADNDTEIGNSIIGQGDYKLTLIIDFGLGDADTIVTSSACCASSTCCTSFTLFTLVTLVAFIALSTDNIAKFATLTIGEGNDQVAIGVDFSTSYTNAVLTSSTSSTCCASSTSFTLFALDALFTLVALVAFITLSANNDTKVRNSIIGQGDYKLTLIVDFGLGDADTIVASSACCTSFALVAFVTLLTLDALFALSASCTCCACRTSITLVTLSTNNNTKVCRLTICICNDKLTAGIDFRSRDTNAVSTIHTNNLVQIDSLAIGEGQNKLAFSIDIGSSNTDAVFASGTILAICTIFTISTILAVCAVQTIGNTKIQHSTIGKCNEQFIILGESGSFNANAILASGCPQRSRPFGFCASIAVLLGNFVGRFAVQTIQPFLDSSFVAVLDCQLIRGQSVFNRCGSRFYLFADDNCSTSSKANNQHYCYDNRNYLFRCGLRHFSFLQIKKCGYRSNRTKKCKLR